MRPIIFEFLVIGGVGRTKLEHQMHHMHERPEILYQSMNHAFKHLGEHFHVPNPLRIKKSTGVVRLYAESYYHSLTEPQLDDHHMSFEWCETAFAKLIKLTHLLNGLDLINGRLVNVHNKCVVTDEFLMQSMHTFKSLGTAFLWSPSMQQTLCTAKMPSICVNKPIYRKPVTVNSLKKVCDILEVSAQQRKLVRLAICPQVTQHRIWTATLEEILSQLKYEICDKDLTKGDKMGQQIVVNCLRFLDDAVAYDPESTSWMHLAPKRAADSPPSAKWADLLEMFNDLTKILTNDQRLLFYVIKLEIMKEGLLQIKDVLVDKNIGYKEARHQENLVQKKLTKSLGHSSQCLFTLLLYYLYGDIRHIELDICCWFSEDVGGNKFYLSVGKILTSDGEKMLRHAVKQLDRALGVIKFVYEMAEMKETLELQGHLWCIGSESGSLDYRGHKFFIHGISL
ncbi:hypothetical protein OSB04_030916 [Centaurea solstitialis]|uniref:Uncharacterized protein n=1 Tax=Centaurea solstitialis TaxID=347529 RepID=A0AA38S9C5_9ASTR|nr:hypothetical protein OSB04_030916 [Centaurea solstitialis]